MNILFYVCMLCENEHRQLFNILKLFYYQGRYKTLCKIALVNDEWLHWLLGGVMCPTAFGQNA